VIAYLSGVRCEGKTHNLNDEVWVYADALRGDYEMEVFDESKVRTKIKDGKKTDKSVIIVNDKGVTRSLLRVEDDQP